MLEAAVLLVDDEDAVRAVLRDVLIAKGYHLLEAASGAEAIRVSAEHRGLIHLVITDVSMPLMSGGDLVHRLRLRRPSLQALFVSGYPEEEILERRLIAPGAKFLQKPFLLATLLDAVRELVARERVEGRGRAALVKSEAAAAGGSGQLLDQADLSALAAS